MKLSLSRFLTSRPQSAYQKALKNFFSSTQTLTSSSPTQPDSLYRRISPLGDPSKSVVPVLDQWVREGRDVGREELRLIIKEFKVYKRFKHALEISQWMTDKRYIPPSPGDIATRLTLIFRVHGLEQVEKYFNSISEQLKDSCVYTALLNCYAQDRSVEKAEGIMQKLRGMEFGTAPVNYNILMTLYYHTGRWEKLDTLVHEMEEKGIYFDTYTFTIRLSAYAAVGDIGGINKIVTRMESDPRMVLNCNTYAVAAKGYLKVGSADKALAMLNKLEGLITSFKKKNVAFDYLLRLYAETGKKDELYRIWNLYKEDKIFNKGYMSMMVSLLRLDDIEGAEKIFEEWESRGLSYDFRIPNFLINAYCRNGQLGKAEALLNRGIARGGNPSTDTWYYLAGGYIGDNEVPKAIEALKKAISVCPPNWRPSKDTLLTCLKYLERRGDVEKAEEFKGLLKVEDIFSETIRDRLLLLSGMRNHNS